MRAITPPLADLAALLHQHFGDVPAAVDGTSMVALSVFQRDQRRVDFDLVAA
jgi:hypothetical protein